MRHDKTEKFYFCGSKWKMHGFLWGIKNHEIRECPVCENLLRNCQKEKKYIILPDIKWEKSDAL